jgi:hypothetical protein
MLLGLLGQVLDCMFDLGQLSVSVGGVETGFRNQKLVNLLDEGLAVRSIRLEP